MRKSFQSLRLGLALCVAAGATAGLAFSVPAHAQQAASGGKKVAPAPAVPILPVVPVPREDRIEVGPPPPRPSMITNPSWARQPQPEFPAAAIAGHIEEGRVTLSCITTPQGALTNCTVTQETPEGYGFGDSALASAGRARLSPRTVDGAVAGARVNFTIRYLAPPPEPELPAPSPIRLR